MEVSSVYIAKEVAHTMIHIARCHPIRRLTLRMCEVTPTVMGKILEACPYLEELTLHKVHRMDAPWMTHIISRVSRNHLQRVAIHHHTSDRLDGSLCTLFHSLDQFPNLQELRLDGSSLGEHDVKAFLQALSMPNSTATILPNLELLSFKSCALSDETVARIVNGLMEHPQRLQRLKTLDFSINQCHDLGIQALGQLLTSPHCRLERLDLICQLPRTGHHPPLSVQPLSRALRINRSLRCLRLSGNEIRDLSLLESLAVNQSLECLDWCGNGVDVDGLAVLNHALTFNRTLRSLNLKSNRFQSLELFNNLLSTNDTLYHLGHSCRGPEAQEIAFWCRLNAAGRRLLRDSPTTSGLWPVVLQRCTHDVDAIHWFLRNVPVLWGHDETPTNC